ncbi:hypothetical protein [Halobacterium zhouii]|uniref:hypothetical protein n=1 Tax=Halobacterium zhouii TaxID=2902624 RepID=UPI001E304322|nr:hypothetical protein [Halobacterium zhouii]
MTRFEATESAERVALAVDAIAAHRDRESAFCTLEADDDPSDDPDFLPPWVQYADGTLNLDCTDEELDALDGVLADFGAFTVESQDSHEDAPGTNVRIEAQTDDERVGQFVERVFRDVYELDEEFRLWAVEV